MKSYLHIGMIMVWMSMVALSADTAPDDTEFVRFKIKNAGMMVDGYFGSFESSVTYDPDNVNASKFKGVIDIRSIHTGIDMRDEHLQKEEYFDADNHPTMSFTSVSVSKGDGGNLNVRGTLTIKGTTKNVDLVVRPVKVEGQMYLETTLELDRRDYGVGGNSWILSDDVKCSIRAKVD